MTAPRPHRCGACGDCGTCYCCETNGVEPHESEAERRERLQAAADKFGEDLWAFFMGDDRAGA